MLVKLEDGGWAHRTLRGEARDLAWMFKAGSEDAIDIAVRDLDEALAVVRGRLTA